MHKSCDHMWFSKCTLFFYAWLCLPFPLLSPPASCLLEGENKQIMPKQQLLPDALPDSKNPQVCMALL